MTELQKARILAHQAQDLANRLLVLSASGNTRARHLWRKAHKRAERRLDTWEIIMKESW